MEQEIKVIQYQLAVVIGCLLGIVAILIVK